MTKKIIKKLTATLGVLMLVGLVASTAYAFDQYVHPGGYHMGPGYGHMGPGYGHWGGQHMGPGWTGRYQTDAATQRLQTRLGDKWRALEVELAKQKPDQARVKALQTEVTNLRTRLSRRVATNRLKYGYGPRGRGGYGRGYGGCW